MAPLIENVSKEAVATGSHTSMGNSAWLIQIVTPATYFPDPKATFSKTFKFEFLDAEDGDDYPDECKFSDEQAKEIALILKKALASNINVLVHCNMGICRSGAVVEVGEILGFKSTGRYRQPNLRVKSKLLKELGLKTDYASDT